MVVTELSGPEGIVAQEVPEPAAEGLVLIDVKASGVCFPDLLITYGKYQIRPEPPFIPGAEISGVVVSAPEGSGFAPGDRVLAAAYLGGYAERIAVNPAQVLRIPDGLAFDEAAYSLDTMGGYEFETTNLRFSYSSMTTPSEVYDYDMATRARILRKRQEIPSGHNPADYVTTRIMATSHDGARVPVSILHRKGLIRDGRAPLLLAGPAVCATSQAVNDWFDRHVDAINEPQRPIPSGRMPGRWGLYIAIGWTLLSMLVEIGRAHV
mgnify:CR=1 FL=1